MASLTIELFGELKLRRDGEVVTLPASKRTRALLAYLAITGRPQRRDRLCEILWELPNDPRGALRWSLSKLRPLVNDGGRERLLADRERVELSTADIALDLWDLLGRVDDPSTPKDELIAVVKKLSEPFLEGIDLPDQELFQRWLTEERAEIQRARAQVVKRLANHAELLLTERHQWCMQWEAAEPFNPDAATALLSCLERLGHTLDVSRMTTEFVRRFRNAGLRWNPQARIGDSDDDAPSVLRLDAKIESRELLTRQKIQFCTAADGVRIAYAAVGKGTPIVKAANWLSHLELDWDAPIWSPLFRELATTHQFIRYDERGNGLSDWDIDDISFDAFVMDLETVVEASGVERFALLGISQGAAVSIAYAVKHPEKVSHLILFGGYAAGWRIHATPDVIAEREAVMTLTATGWGQNNPAYRQIFSSTFLPSATPEELTWFNEFQRLTTSPANAVRFLSVFGNIDVRGQLAKVQAPTLVIHSQEDQRIPIQTGRDIAASIPNAEFICLPSDGHLLLGREPASTVFVDAVREFVRRP